MMYLLLLCTIPKTNLVDSTSLSIPFPVAVKRLFEICLTDIGLILLMILVLDDGLEEVGDGLEYE